ncbi:ABC transporter permease [Marinomonas pollencensis]|uniref:Peptide/nickel transport system permease protein n=1 Tax=Marinomonas pollencensis TaxID=491954 RepID=A0A3E0DHB4_9GAMM|nr:ABC transporter permease [Marinomonas pollencensis]REG81989.1 peptide/nickel transport system permease protein [Marinomonas pollencensis]
MNLQTLLYIGGRLIKGVIILLIIAVFNFFLIRAAPGDPAKVMAGEAGATDEVFLQQLREQFGLDQPLYYQLWVYISNLLHFDMGMSYRQNIPVFDLIMDRLPATLLLTGTAFLLSIALGVLAGVIASVNYKKWVDSLITILSLIFYATPLFWLAIMASLFFSVYLGWLPGFGMETVGVELSGWDRVIDIALHLVLPATTLGLFFTAVYARMTRTSMIETSRLDFVKTAIAKGMTPSRVTRKHVLRNALLPVITLAGIQAGQLIGGAVLTETVFAWPGIGRLMFEALFQRDYNLLLGVFFISSAMVVLFNLITDVIYCVVDPRIELSK